MAKNIGNGALCEAVEISEDEACSTYFSSMKQPGRFLPLPPPLDAQGYPSIKFSSTHLYT